MLLKSICKTVAITVMNKVVSPKKATRRIQQALAL